MAILLSSLFFVNYLWESVDHTVLGIWYGLTVVFNLARYATFSRFEKISANREQNAINYTFWHNLFFTGVLFSGLLWSVTIFFPFEHDPLRYMHFVIIVLILLISGTVTLNSSSAPLVYSYIAIMLIPSILHFTYTSGIEYATISIMLILYMFSMFRIVSGLNHTIISNIRMKIENQHLTLIDPLTGLWNRRQLYQFMDKLIPETKKKGVSFGILFFDLDDFKKYNDKNGHIAGDNLLKKTAEILKKETGPDDLSVRFGSEEFLVVFPGADAGKTGITAEQIRKRIKKETGISISGGITTFDPSLDVDGMIKRADRALYSSKSGGKNRITVAAPKAAKWANRPVRKS